MVTRAEDKLFIPLFLKMKLQTVRRLKPKRNLEERSSVKNEPIVIQCAEFSEAFLKSDWLIFLDSCTTTPASILWETKIHAQF